MLLSTHEFPSCFIVHDPLQSWLSSTVTLLLQRGHGQWHIPFDIRAMVRSPTESVNKSRIAAFACSLEATQVEFQFEDCSTLFVRLYCQRRRDLLCN